MFSYQTSAVMYKKRCWRSYRDKELDCTAVWHEICQVFEQAIQLGDSRVLQPQPILACNHLHSFNSTKLFLYHTHALNKVNHHI